MSADRRIPVSTTPGAVTGNNFMDAVQEELDSLNNRSICKLTVVGGTADAIKCTIDPPLTGSLVDRMRFEITPTGANTISGFTIEIVDAGNSPPSTVIAATGVVDRDAAAIASGNWKSGRTHLLTYDASLAKYRVLTNIEPAPAAATPLPSFRNVLMNGGMEIWQRGAGDAAIIAVPASTTAYTADRWYLTTGANQASTVSRSAGVLSFRSRSAGTVQRNAGQTGTGTIVFSYPLTTEECARLRNEKISLQFLINAGTNFSPASGTVNYNVYFGTGTEGKRGAGFTGETNPISGSVNLTANTITPVSVTSASTIANNVTQGELRFTWTPVGTAGALDALTFDDVQLEASSTPTTFEYLPFNYMMSEVQRHYCKTFPYATAPAQNAGAAGALATSATGDVGNIANAAISEWRFPRQMRTSPTIVTYNPSAADANWRNTRAANSSTVTVNPSSVASQDSAVIANAGTGNLGNTSDLLIIHVTADASL